jgi:NAD(P)-dependent dehydrogenase (short-subunit alcohol dehydrogenase family)
VKTVLITGSEGQLGKSYVSKLKELNYNIIAFDIAPETEDREIHYYQVDITKQKEVVNVISKLSGQIDVLINNAGVSVFTPFEERTEEELDFVIGVNLKGSILMTQAVFNRFFKPRKKGCVVNIGSIYGLVAGDMKLYKEGDRRTPEIYGATKAAVINVTKYFSAYMASYNVRVNCISPGGIFNHQNNEFIQKYSRKVPMERMGKSEELLSTLEYLISDESSYVTGQNIVVDGGLTTW